LCEHLHHVVRNRVSEFDLQAYRDEFNTALDTDTELLRDNSILDRRGESTREGFAKEARVEVFCFNRAGVWRQRRIGLVFVQRSEKTASEKSAQPRWQSAAEVELSEFGEAVLC
jgi:hypothetical protein